MLSLLKGSDRELLIENSDIVNNTLIDLTGVMARNKVSVKTFMNY